MGIHRNFVNSRADFFRVLNDTLAETKALAGPTAGWAPLESVLYQLDAMKRWTAFGRNPTTDERKSINIGQLLTHEFEGTPDSMYEYKQKLYELSGYFKEWLTDEELANYDESDLLSDFYD